MSDGKIDSKHLDRVKEGNHTASQTPLSASIHTHACQWIALTGFNILEEAARNSLVLQESRRATIRVRENGVHIRTSRSEGREEGDVSIHKD